MDTKNIQKNLKSAITNFKKGGGFSNSELTNLSKLKDKLHDEFKNATMNQLNQIKERESSFEPITKALKEVENAVKESSLVPVTENRLLETENRLLEIQENPLPKVVNLGPLTIKYLPLTKDSKFGIYYDRGEGKYFIGNQEISFDGNNIKFINWNTIVEGTEGLWKLLSDNQFIESDLYTDKDWNTYKNILITTNSIYQRNDIRTKKPKSSVSDKYTKMIAPIWRSLNKTGGLLKKYSDQPIEYKYIDNLNQLLNRLNFIASEERAGNNSKVFYNEKIGIIKFISEEIQKHLDTPQGTEILIKYVASLPRRIVKGDGLINNILNSKYLPPLHYPGYNYLGPGTPLQNNINKGVKPKNKLDEAALHHDIFYHLNKETKDRHEADKVLENRAWEIFKNKETDLGEKVASYVTTNVMKAKRYLGMGII